MATLKAPFSLKLQQGLFRHVIKGSIMEEVIKGSLASMGSPAYYLSGMAFLDKENLLICYNGNLMKAYKYNPDISQVFHLIRQRRQIIDSAYILSCTEMKSKKRRNRTDTFIIFIGICNIFI